MIYKTIRKIAVLVAGSIVLLFGIILIFIPGPAFVVIPTGIAILSIEFPWAKRLFRKMKYLFYRVKKKFYEVTGRKKEPQYEESQN